EGQTAFQGLIATAQGGEVGLVSADRESSVKCEELGQAGDMKELIFRHENQPPWDTRTQHARVGVIQMVRRDYERAVRRYVLEACHPLMGVNRQKEIVDKVSREPVEGRRQHQFAPASANTRSTTWSRVRSLVAMT